MDGGFDAHFLTTIKGELLDDYLKIGWYRMSMFIFTTHELTVDGIGHPVFWLRYHVPSINPGKEYERLVRINEQFVISCRPFTVNRELEALHSRYHAHIQFETPASLSEIMFDHGGEIFDAHVIEIKHNGRLIAAGMFDKGRQSIAGIKSIYDPSYKKHSLGKYLLLLKQQYCLLNDIPWYYPGYFSTSYPKFDYKLSLDKNATEVYLPGENKWIPYHDFVTLFQDRAKTLTNGKG